MKKVSNMKKKTKTRISKKKNLSNPIAVRVNMENFKKLENVCKNLECNMSEAIRLVIQAHFQTEGVVLEKR
jgi:DNA-binding Xre family transcriptional regulator